MTVADVRVGIDVVSVAEVQRSLERFGDRYLRRIFTEHEICACDAVSAGGTEVTSHLAARFAAKEATIKVLRVQGSQPRWTEMEVVRHGPGYCEMRLSGLAGELAQAQGLSMPMTVSLSHEGDVAAAVVTALVSF